MLRISHLRVHYELVEVVRNISMHLDVGGSVCLVGANGAGKTTVLRCISGLKTATSGEIWFQGKRIDHLRPHHIAGLGISHVPQGRRLFSSMTVFDNLLLGGFSLKNNSIKMQNLERMYEHFPILKRRTKLTAGSMSGGEQQMLAVARALMSQPSLLLMDEPSLGLAPLVVAELAKIIEGIGKDGVGIVLVEQNARLAFKLTMWAYVMELGKITIEGKSQEVAKDQRVMKAYLGG